MPTYSFIPRFFLFSDIDSKDPEQLRLVIQHFARNGLSFFVLETRKGYHVISPDLLNIQEWTDLQPIIKKAVPNYYRFHVIRIENKIDDNFIHYYTNWYNGKRSISHEFLALMEKRFNRILIEDIDVDHMAKKTYLQFIRYTHHEIE